MILISFDIGGTLEVSDPPGILSMEMVRRAQEKGFLIGSCSDLPISVQKAIWVQHKIPVDFVVPKHLLREVKAKFEADVYCQISDRLVDKRIALEAGLNVVGFLMLPHYHKLKGSRS